MIAWNDYQFKQYLTADKLLFDLPPGVSISTMCASGKLGTNINIQNIKNYLPLSIDDILTVKINKQDIRTLVEEKKKKRRTKRKASVSNNPFYNQITLVIRINEGPYEHIYDEPLLNIKLFQNGSIQISGLKNIEFANRALNKLIYCLGQSKGKFINNIINEITFVAEPSAMTITHFNIYMINSNYMVNLMIDRSKLYKLLLMKRVKAQYEKCVRACVTVKYIPKIENPEEKDISIFIFEKGNIIITGARNCHHIIDTYHYINRILLEHVDDIIKKDDVLEGNNILKLYDDIYKENSHKLSETHTHMGDQ